MNQVARLLGTIMFLYISEICRLKLRRTGLMPDLVNFFLSLSFPFMKAPILSQSSLKPLLIPFLPTQAGRSRELEGGKSGSWGPLVLQVATREEPVVC